MPKIREIGEDELEAFVGVMARAMPREDTGGATGLIDWRRQAEAMIWLLAEVDDEVVGAGYALTGWHTPSHRGIGSALVVPERRGHGIGDRLRGELERWAAEHGATELEGPVAEDDNGSLAWAIEAPAVEPPPGIEIVTWAERPDLAEGLWEVAREAAPDIPGEEETDVGELDEWLERDMRGSGDRPEAVFVAVEGGEVLG